MELTFTKHTDQWMASCDQLQSVLLTVQFYERELWDNVV